jgi:hypothetical protein
MSHDKTKNTKISFHIFLTIKKSVIFRFFIVMFQTTIRYESVIALNPLNQNKGFRAFLSVKASKKMIEI